MSQSEKNSTEEENGIDVFISSPIICSNLVNKIFLALPHRGNMFSGRF